MRVPGVIEEDVDDHSLRWRQGYVLNKLLTLDMATVAADKLHFRSRHGNPEDSGVRGISQEVANHLLRLRLQREVGLPVGKHHIAEAAHGRVCRLLGAERGDPTVLEQYVVERDRDFAMSARPIVGISRLDQDIAVEAHLLAIVLTDVRVVPVDPEDRGMRPAR